MPKCQSKHPNKLVGSLMWQPQRSCSCGKRTSLESVSQCAGPAGALVSSTVFNSARLDFQHTRLAPAACRVQDLLSVLTSKPRAAPSFLPKGTPMLAPTAAPPAAQSSSAAVKPSLALTLELSAAVSCSQQLTEQCQQLAECKASAGSNLGSAAPCRL